MVATTSRKQIASTCKKTSHMKRVGTFKRSSHMKYLEPGTSRNKWETAKIEQKHGQMIDAILKRLKRVSDTKKQLTRPVPRLAVELIWAVVANVCTCRPVWLPRGGRGCCKQAKQKSTQRRLWPQYAVQRTQSFITTHHRKHSGKGRFWSRSLCNKQVEGLLLEYWGFAMFCLNVLATLRQFLSSLGAQAETFDGIYPRFLSAEEKSQATSTCFHWNI